jgi:hypothetical protein
MRGGLLRAGGGLAAALVIGLAAPLAAQPVPGRKPPPPPKLLAAGDIASCSSSGDEATAALLDKRPGTIAALGDLAYDDGTASEFARSFVMGTGGRSHYGVSTPEPNSEVRNDDVVMLPLLFGARRRLRR